MALLQRRQNKHTSSVRV